MSHSSFDERRKALENAYFHKQDLALATMRHDMMDRALLVAEAAGGILGFHKVAREERAKLEELGVLLEELTAAFD